MNVGQQIANVGSEVLSKINSESVFVFYMITKELEVRINPTGCKG